VGGQGTGSQSIVAMSKSRLHSFALRQTVSRRMVLLGCGAAILGLAGCADQASDRQFAGDPKTTEPGGSSPALATGTLEVGSPTAVPTSLPISELLAPRGTQEWVVATRPQVATIIEATSGKAHAIWQNDERVIWAAKRAPSSSAVALLTSAADRPIDWAVEFVDAVSSEATVVEIGDWAANGEDHPDAVVGGTGGIAWLPDARSIVLALPTGGLFQIFPDGSQIKVAKASVAKRPSALAISPDGTTIAFVDQPSSTDGSGIFAGSMKAKPIDPIVVLPADRSGNRFARGVAWVGTTSRVATIIDREELGTTQGDLFFLDTQTRVPQLVWTSSSGRDVASVEAFEISPDAVVTAFVTNSARRTRDKPSSVWVSQNDGPAIERFDLPVELGLPRLAFTTQGIAVSGLISDDEDGIRLVAAFLLAPNGKMISLYREAAEATPIASPLASPVPSPVASPSPVEVTDSE